MRIDGRTLSHGTSETIRHLAVQRVQDGERPSSVIASYGMCRTSIYRWLRAAQRGGKKALQARKHPGRPPALSPRQKLQVRRWINGKGVCVKFVGADSSHPLSQAAERQRSSHRLLRIRHRSAITALAPATVQRMPDCLRR
jgi:transposase